MITINDWRKHFPFDEVRPLQEQAIDFVLNAITNGEDTIILDLGTGVGKSAIAKTIATYFSMELKDASYFLTTQKILQQQYINDFGGNNAYQHMQSVFASSNYECHNCPGQATCGEVRSSFAFDTSSWIEKCKTPGCTYLNKKLKFVESKLGLTNYSFFLSHNGNPETITKRAFIFHDECHNIERELSSHVGFEITKEYCEFLNIKFCQEPLIDDIFIWIQENYKDAVYKQFAKATKDMELRPNAIHAESLGQWTQYNDQLINFITFYQKDKPNWVVNVNEEVISFNPIDIAGFAQDKLFAYGQINILMSATVVNIPRFAESLGIKKYASLSIDSPFPYENRPVFFYPAGSMSMDKIEKTLPNLVEYINNILDMHKDEKGIIHCHSYKILKYLQNNIKNKRLLFQDKKNKDFILRAHSESKEATVLVSPSMTEGIDLKDDLSRFQIICKLPYPYLGDQLVVARKEKWSWWYSLETIKVLIQSVGRSIRNEDDTASTYILDSSFDAFIHKNRTLFPPAFLTLLEHSE